MNYRQVLEIVYLDILDHKMENISGYWLILDYIKIGKCPNLKGIDTWVKYH